MRDYQTYLPIDLDNPINKMHKFAQGLGACYIGIPSITGGKAFYDLMGKISIPNINSQSNKPKWTRRPCPTGFYGIDFSSSTTGSDFVPMPTAITLGTNWTISCWLNG